MIHRSIALVFCCRPAVSSILFTALLLNGDCLSRLWKQECTAGQCGCRTTRHSRLHSKPLYFFLQSSFIPDLTRTFPPSSLLKASSCSLWLSKCLPKGDTVAIGRKSADAELLSSLSSNGISPFQAGNCFLVGPKCPNVWRISHAQRDIQIVCHEQRRCSPYKSFLCLLNAPHLPVDLLFPTLENVWNVLVCRR